MGIFNSPDDNFKLSDYKLKNFDLASKAVTFKCKNVPNKVDFVNIIHYHSSVTFNREGDPVFNIYENLRGNDVDVVYVSNSYVDKYTNSILNLSFADSAIFDIEYLEKAVNLKISILGFKLDHENKTVTLIKEPQNNFMISEDLSLVSDKKDIPGVSFLSIYLEKLANKNMFNELREYIFKINTLEYNKDSIECLSEYHLSNLSLILQNSKYKKFLNETIYLAPMFSLIYTVDELDDKISKSSLDNLDFVILDNIASGFFQKNIKKEIDTELFKKTLNVFIENKDILRKNYFTNIKPYMLGNNISVGKRLYGQDYKIDKATILNRLLNTTDNFIFNKDEVLINKNIDKFKNIAKIGSFEKGLVRTKDKMLDILTSEYYVFLASDRNVQLFNLIVDYDIILALYFLTSVDLTYTLIENIEEELLEDIHNNKGRKINDIIKKHQISESDLLNHILFSLNGKEKDVNKMHWMQKKNHLSMQEILLELKDLTNNNFEIYLLITSILSIVMMDHNASHNLKVSDDNVYFPKDAYSKTISMLKITITLYKKLNLNLVYNSYYNFINHLLLKSFNNDFLTIKISGIMNNAILNATTDYIFVSFKDFIRSSTFITETIDNFNEDVIASILGKDLDEISKDFALLNNARNYYIKYNKEFEGEFIEEQNFYKKCLNDNILVENLHLSENKKLIIRDNELIYKVFDKEYII